MSKALQSIAQAAPAGNDTATSIPALWQRREEARAVYSAASADPSSDDAVLNALYLRVSEAEKAIAAAAPSSLSDILVMIRCANSSLSDHWSVDDGEDIGETGNALRLLRRIGSAAERLLDDGATTDPVCHQDAQRRRLMAQYVDTPEIPANEAERRRLATAWGDLERLMADTAAQSHAGMIAKVDLAIELNDGGSCPDGRDERLLRGLRDDLARMIGGSNPQVRQGLAGDPESDPMLAARDEWQRFRDAAAAASRAYDTASLARPGRGDEDVPECAAHEAATDALYDATERMLAIRPATLRGWLAKFDIFSQWAAEQFGRELDLSDRFILALNGDLARLAPNLLAHDRPAGVGHVAPSIAAE